MNKSSIQPKRPRKVEIVILWHWAIVVAIAWVALSTIVQFDVLVLGGSVWLGNLGGQNPDFHIHLGR